jgi:hypothetical protein
MEDLLPILIQVAGGAVGGNIVGALLKNASLGTVGNTVVGALGGGAGNAFGLGSTVAAMLGGGDGGLMDIVGQAAGGGVGGLVLTAIVGLIKNMLSK